MSTLFPVPTEKRYADYPRRFLVEYHVDGRTKLPDGKGSCATLHSARKHAVASIDGGYCFVTRIFDRMIGQYLWTYKSSVNGIIRHEGYVK